jgi:FkbM family methyltransferase
MRNEIKIRFEEPKYEVNPEKGTVECFLRYEVLYPDFLYRIFFYGETVYFYANGFAKVNSGDVFDENIGKKISLAIDAGAYRGDTAEEMKAYIPSLEKIYAIEPDLRNFRKLEAYSKAESDVSVVPINAAAWSENSFGDFNSSGNRNSTISATASFEHKEASVRLLMLDSLSSEQIDYIKYDVEGAEYEALVGSQRIIREHSPALLVSLYHRSRDIFFLINYLRKSYPHYSLYLRRERCLPAWEIDLIMIPKG